MLSFNLTGTVCFITIRTDKNEKQSLCHTTFNVIDITEAIKDTAINSATGPGEIPSFFSFLSFFFFCKEVTAKPLVNVWRKSSDMGLIPS